MAFILDQEKSWFQRDFGLDLRLIKALSKLGFTYPTVVQAKSIPIALQGKDILVRARTGSGKTAAFLLPLLHKILTSKEAEKNPQSKIRALILAPTKELCKQIEKNTIELIYYCKETISLCAFSDDNQTVQLYRLKAKPDILITTPSRLVYHMKNNQQSLDFSNITTLVIDEADLILSFGYSDDVQTITSKMPKIFQGLLMSATLSPELDKFKRVVLHNPAVIKLQETQGTGHLQQFYLESTAQDKYLILYVFIKLGLLQGKGVVFVNDINTCYRLKLFLQQFFIPAAVLNAELPVNTRLHILEEFNRGVFDYLIATDASVDAGEDDERDENNGGGDEEEEEEGTIQQETEMEQEQEQEESAEEDEEGDGDDSEDGSDDEKLEQEEEENNEEGEEEGEDEEEDGEDDANTSTSTPATGKSKNKNSTSSTPTRGLPPGGTGKSTRGGRGGGGGAGGGRPVDEDYGVSRGIDFQRVAFVVNFDFPQSAAAYTHRIGRTARAGASGTALSFACGEDDGDVLLQVQAQQTPLHAADADSVLASLAPLSQVDGGGAGGGGLLAQSVVQPSPLQFNPRELDGFRYRVEDTLRSVTTAAVRESRAAEIKAEILNSQRLKTYFADNPNDLKILRHDKSVLHPIRQKEHLRHVPDYLVPASMRSFVGTAGNRRKKRRRLGGASQEQRKSSSRARDPLRSFDDGTGDAQDGADGAGTAAAEQAAVSERVFTDNDTLGYSTAGRQKWKMRHKLIQSEKKTPLRTPGSFSTLRGKKLRSQL